MNTHYMKLSATVGLAVGALIVSAPSSLADNYSISWHSVDGGGQMVSTGGSYSLGGTIGQPDANSISATLTGGAYSLIGGFWPVAVCSCPADMNFDRLKNGLDVQGFVQCYVLATSVNCGCADLDHDGALNSTDVSLFVAGLLAAAACP